MGYFARLALALVASILVHGLLDQGMARLDEPEEREPYTVKIAITRQPEPVEPEPEPPPEPPKPPEPPEPPPEPEPVFEAPPPTPPPPKPPPRRPPPKKPPPAAPPPVPKVLPPPNTTEEPPSDAPARPRHGISMSSTSSAGSGPRMPTGNTLDPAARKEKPAPDDGPVEPYAPPAPVETVTRMPRMKGNCRGSYTPEAKAAGLEGTVVLSLVVDAEGRARDIQVVKGLGLGLDENARKTLAACRFRPGTKDGKPVSVRLRSFKIRYVLGRD